MALCQLPNELLQMIVGLIDSESSINSLVRTSRALFVQFNPFLYWYHVLRPPHNLRTGLSIPALKWAVKHDDPGLLGRLLDAGADLDFYKTSLWRRGGPLSHHPIRVAARGGHVRVLEALLDIDDNGSQLRESDYAQLVADAVSQNNIHVVRMLLSRDVDPWCDGASVNKLLSTAARRENPELLELLLADFTQRSTLPPIAEWKNAYTALFHGNNREHIMRLLLTAGINVNGIDAIRERPVRYGEAIWRPLCRYDHPGPVRLLLEAGADPNIDQDDKWGPLACVVDNYRYTAGFHISSLEQRDRRMEMFQLFFEYGADPKKAGGGAALHGALRDLDFRSATLLADKGARIIVAELTAPDQELLDEAVVEHEWGTVMRLTPHNWSIVGYIGPGMIRKRRCIERFVLPTREGDVPPWLTNENRVIYESEAPPLPSYVSQSLSGGSTLSPDDRGRN